MKGEKRGWQIAKQSSQPLRKLKIKRREEGQKNFCLKFIIIK